MDARLLNVISSSYSIRESIRDSDLVLELTQKVDAFTMRWFDWGKIRHLHILGSSDFPEVDSLRDGKLKPGYYLDKKTGSWLLIIGVSVTRIQEHLSRCGAALEWLTVGLTSMEELDLSRMTNLTYLDVSYNDRLRQIEGLELLTELQNLSLANTQIGPVLDLNPYPRLRGLLAFGTPLREIRLDHPLEELSVINCSATAIHDSAFLTHLPSLTWLFMERCAIRRLPENFPAAEGLYYVDLSGLTLEDLPDWFPDMMKNTKLFSAYDTTVEGTEPGFLEQPRAVIYKWFEDRKRSAGGPLNEVKVVFLGDGEAGKSHTIARLLHDGGAPENFNGDATPGVVITDKSYGLGDRRVQVHFWDFGGQEILHSMHRMFLTERTLYVILINARDDTQDDRARYWLHNVKSFAGGAPVLLVLNKMDQNPNASVNESDLRAIYPGLTEVVKLSAMYDSPEQFNSNFTEAMKRQIGAMKDLNYFFPAAWTEAKRRLLDMTDNYIHGSDYWAICDQCGVSEEDELRRSLLNWFHDLGVSICYSGSARLKDYVILRPNWITNAVYAILFNKHPDTKNGIISHEAIFEMIQPTGKAGDSYRRTNPGERYTQPEIEYILNVMRRFRLSFRVNDDQEFIPVLCQRESLAVAAEYAGAEDTLEFRMTFDYLPSNVLHRLMVELRQDLDTTRVWRTGAHFEQRSSGLSAVVKSEGNVLKFYVRSAGKDHKASTYLCILKDAVDSIVKDMNLEPPLNEVVYKLEGKRQVFDYDELVESRDNGEITRYSRVHKRRLRIEDILNQTGREAEEARERLLGDLVSSCCQLQANKQNWNAREDVRNTYIRDLLRARGYHVFDQTFSGRSADGKQAGELDLEIRLDANVPWTICEAMNLKGAGESQIKYWNAHLDKLLDDYNANGLPFLFLISYVDCGRDSFGAVTGAFREHLHFHSPEAYARQSAEDLPLDALRHEQSHYIQAAKCVYDRGGFRTTVYHLFVRMGE